MTVSSGIKNKSYGVISPIRAGNFYRESDMKVSAPYLVSVDDLQWGLVVGLNNDGQIVNTLTASRPVAGILLEPESKRGASYTNSDGEPIGFSTGDVASCGYQGSIVVLGVSTVSSSLVGQAPRVIISGTGLGKVTDATAGANVKQLNGCIIERVDSYDGTTDKLVQLRISGSLALAA